MAVRPLVLVQANWQASPVLAILTKLPALAGLVELRLVDRGQPLQEMLDQIGSDRVRLVAVWEQVVEYWEPERWRMPVGWPASIALVRFPLIEVNSFWPLAYTDPRNVPEPTYQKGRYPFSDHIAARMASVRGTEDAIYERYLAASIEALPDMEAALIADIARFASRDAFCDVRFTLFFLEEYRRQKLFHATASPAGESYTCLAAQLTRRLAARIGLDPGDLEAAVRRFSRGITGLSIEQFPIHPEVARRLGLAWCTEQTRFRSFKTEWTFRQSMVRAINWSGWVV